MKNFNFDNKIFLWLANHRLTRWIFGLNRLPLNAKEMGFTGKIDRITPAAIHWKTGKVFKKGKEWHEEWATMCFTRPRFAEAFTKTFYPFFYLIHLWDTLFANNFKPAWNLGFDELNVWTGAGDGTVWNSGSNYSTVRNATNGNNAQPTIDEYPNANNRQPGPTYYVGRMYFPTNTSSLPDDATISSAVFTWHTGSIYAKSLSTPGANGDGRLVQTTQSDPTTLVVGDYSQIGTTDGGTIAYANITNNAYNNITLNTTGLGWISKTGWTMLGLRIVCDINGTVPTADYQMNRWGGCYSEYAGTDHDPYLNIVYTLPLSPSNAFFAFFNS